MSKFARFCLKMSRFALFWGKILQKEADHIDLVVQPNWCDLPPFHFFGFNRVSSGTVFFAEYCTVPFFGNGEITVPQSASIVLFF